MGVQAQADLAARCQPIELLVADVDGVLTDGVIALDDNGVETKHFTSETGWPMRSGTARENRRQFSPVVVRRQSSAGLPS